MILTVEAVRSLIDHCLFKPAEDRTGAINVEGITTDYSFHRDRIQESTAKIAELIAELPDQFRQSVGSGSWRAHTDRHGQQWAILHLDIEALLCLAVAAKKGKWLAPSSRSDDGFAAVPYFVVVD